MLVLLEYTLFMVVPKAFHQTVLKVVPIRRFQFLGELMTTTLVLLGQFSMKLMELLLVGLVRH